MKLRLVEFYLHNSKPFYWLEYKKWWWIFWVRSNSNPFWNKEQGEKWINKYKSK